MAGSFSATTPSGTVAASSLIPTFSATYTRPATDPGDFTLRVRVRRVSDNALMWQSETTAALVASGSTLQRTYAGTPLTQGVAYTWQFDYFRAGLGTENADVDGSPVSFTLVLNTAPTATQTSPANAAQVGTLTPPFSFGFSDPDTIGTFGDFDAYQIEVRRNSDDAGFWTPGYVSASASQKAAKAVTGLVYAGTTLVSGTVYKWRVRVRDGGGLQSAFTSYRTFTPVAAPNPPTVSSPSGLTNTLTPTIQGSYNQATGGTEDFFQYEIRQGLTTTIYSSGDVAADIATGQAYGTDNSGDTPSSPPSLAWGTQYYVRARSKDNLGSYSDWSAWQAFNTNSRPDTPTVLSPKDDLVTGDTTPTLSWQHNEPTGEADAQTVAEIELIEVGVGFVTGYDPKELTQSTTTHDVTETLTDSPTDYQWRVRTKGLTGPGFSDWSDFGSFTVAPAPTVTVDEPDPDDEITAPSLTVEWTFSGGSGTQQDYRVVIYESDQTTIVHDSGVVAGTADSYVVPSVLANGQTYYVQVILRDDLSQQGESAKVRFTTNFTPPDTITGVGVTFFGGDDDLALPQALVSWDQSELAVADFVAYRVERKRTTEDDDAWETIAFIRDITVTSFQDFGFDPGVQQDWSVTQIQDQGTSEVESERPTPAQGSHDWETLFIHARGNPGQYAAIEVDLQRIDLAPTIILKRPWGRTLPIAHAGRMLPAVYRGEVRDATWEDSYPGRDRTVWDALRVLLTAQAEDGAVFVARQSRDINITCVFTGPVGRSDGPIVFDAAIELQEVGVDEEEVI